MASTEEATMAAEEPITTVTNVAPSAAAEEGIVVAVRMRPLNQVWRRSVGFGFGRPVPVVSTPSPPSPFTRHPQPLPTVARDQRGQQVRLASITTVQRYHAARRRRRAAAGRRVHHGPRRHRYNRGAVRGGLL